MPYMTAAVRHTNEMGGTLLVELLDGNVYEISRYNSGYSIRPDEGHRKLTKLEERKLIIMFKRSSCFWR